MIAYASMTGIQRLYGELQDHHKGYAMAVTAEGRCLAARNDEEQEANGNASRTPCSPICQGAGTSSPAELAKFLGEEPPITAKPDEQNG